MENTQKTPETLKPEQMESGKWYWVETRNNFLIKFNCIKGKMITKTKCFIVNKEREGFSNHLCHISNIKSIKEATKDEVLKYFPDEVFEPIELRPEDLVSGEVYTAKIGDEKYTFKFDKLIDRKSNPLIYYSMYNHQLKRKLTGYSMSITNIKFYHATPEEKKLLLGEEETELEKVKKLLEESNRLYALKTIEFTKLQEKFEKLSAYNDELTERINQTETKNNQEKVYFYFNEKELLWLACTNKEFAIEFSKNNHPIYEAVCIGKKKSVLVSE